LKHDLVETPKSIVSTKSRQTHHHSQKKIYIRKKTNYNYWLYSIRKKKKRM